jgi:hypothetical protein
LQKKFKHAADFGVLGPPNAANLAKYDQAIKNLVASAATQHIQGFYRGLPAIINVNPVSALAVVTALNTEFITGWKLNGQQLHYVLTIGKLGGS